MAVGLCMFVSIVVEFANVAVFAAFGVLWQDRQSDRCRFGSRFATAILFRAGGIFKSEHSKNWFGHKAAKFRWRYLIEQKSRFERLARLSMPRERVGLHRLG